MQIKHFIKPGAAALVALFALAVRAAGGDVDLGPLVMWHG